MSDESLEQPHALRWVENRTESTSPPQSTFAAPTGSVLRRDRHDAAESCKREGWEEGFNGIYAIFTKRNGETVRVIMLDGRSGSVEWDSTPNTKLTDSRESL